MVDLVRKMRKDGAYDPFLKGTNKRDQVALPTDLKGEAVRLCSQKLEFLIQAGVKITSRVNKHELIVLQGTAVFNRRDQLRPRRLIYFYSKILRGIQFVRSLFPDFASAMPTRSGVSPAWRFSCAPWNMSHEAYQRMSYKPLCFET